MLPQIVSHMLKYEIYARSIVVDENIFQFENIIVGEPIMVACFNQNVMSIASSSAVLSSQAFSQATTAAALQSS